MKRAIDQPLQLKEFSDLDREYPDNLFDKDLKVAEIVMSFILFGIITLLILAGI